MSCLDTAQYALAPKHLISIVVLDFGASLYNEAQGITTPDWQAGHVPTGLRTCVIDFIRSPLFIEQGSPELNAMAEAAIPEIDAARAAILDGSLTVEFNTNL